MVNCPSGATAEEFLSLALQRLRSLVTELEAAGEDIAKEKARLQAEEKSGNRTERTEKGDATTSYASSSSSPSPSASPLSSSSSSNGVDPGVRQEEVVIGLFHPSHHERSIAGQFPSVCACACAVVRVRVRLCVCVN